MTDERFKELDDLCNAPEWWIWDKMPEEIRFEYHKEKERRIKEQWLTAYKKAGFPVFELKQETKKEEGRCVNAFQYQNEIGGYTAPTKRGKADE